MKNIFIFFLKLSIAGIGIFFSCKKEKLVDALPQAIKLSPKAYAGYNQFIRLPVDSTELTGKGVDLDGSIVSYAWKYISGPNSFVIVNQDSAATRVRNLQGGVYEFELTVKDNDGLQASARVSIFVIDPANSSCGGCWDY